MREPQKNLKNQNEKWLVHEPPFDAFGLKDPMRSVLSQISLVGLECWIHDLMAKNFRSCYLLLVFENSLVFILIATSALAHSFLGITCEPDCVCFQCLG